MEALISQLCSKTFLAMILLVTGISCYQLVHRIEGVISKTKAMDFDLYRAILFPNRRSYEADITGLSALFFYARFRNAAMSGDFPELDSLRIEHRKISAHASVFLAAVLCLITWAVECKTS